MTFHMVVGVHDDACEVLFDLSFPEGTDLAGRCSSKCGAILAASELLNLSKPHAVAVTGADFPPLPILSLSRISSSCHLHLRAWRSLWSLKMINLDGFQVPNHCK